MKKLLKWFSIACSSFVSTLSIIKLNLCWNLAFLTLSKDLRWLPFQFYLLKPFIRLMLHSKTLHKKQSFPLRISPKNVTKSEGNCGLFKFTEEIVDKNFIFCEVRGGMIWVKELWVILFFKDPATGDYVDFIKFWISHIIFILNFFLLSCSNGCVFNP